MPQIPQYNRQVKLNATPLPYEKYNLNGDMFGASIATAIGNAGNSLGRIADAALNITNTLDETQVMKFNNDIEQWRQTNILDKDNGYLSKQGENAAGKSPEVMKSYDDFVEEWKANNRVSRFNTQRIDEISTRKRSGILDNVTAHDVKQTNFYAATQGKIGIDNAITNIVADRNNPESIKMQLANIDQITAWQGELTKADAKTIELNKMKNKSDALCSVLDTYLQEGDLKAGEFFKQYQSQIQPEQHAKYIGAIKNEEDKYQARSMAQDIIANSSSEQEAIKKAEAIKDVNMSDSVLSRVKQHYSEEEHFKNLAERDSLNSFYTKAVAAAQNGQTLSYDDIPDNLDPQVKLGLMNYVNSNGQPKTDDSVWEDLYNKQVNDAQGFANEDLNKYRGFLSDGEYKSFVKAQQDIKAGKYYSNIQDDNKLVDSALEALKLNRGEKENVAYSEIRSMVREYEARKGRKITDDELTNLTNSLGYTGSDGTKLYKQVEKGMAERVGFIKGVMNDFVYYQSQHNGQMPPDAEKYKIIQNRVNQKVGERKTQAQQRTDMYKTIAYTMRNILYTTAKPHETKTLAYFADNQIPTVSKQLGIKLTVTSRYRNQAGSHHAEGRAADVSMSEHSAKNRIRIYEKLLSLPTVQAIGTSDPNILAHFNGNKKIVDERKYDRQHGTNHVNHAHVTLINYNPADGVRTANKTGNVYRF